ncbi:hypothetical protein [Nonomuraea roseola]|uniref:Uncharacterized protein n=1 Tax=Nonomuraea roseola TaxID=46179 RepID=A0ABV5Q269_9ACTN
MPDGSPIDAGDDWDEWKAILKEAEIDKDGRKLLCRDISQRILLYH